MIATTTRSSVTVKPRELVLRKITAGASGRLAEKPQAIVDHENASNRGAKDQLRDCQQAEGNTHHIPHQADLLSTPPIWDFVKNKIRWIRRNNYM